MSIGPTDGAGTRHGAGLALRDVGWSSPVLLGHVSFLLSKAVKEETLGCFEQACIKQKSESLSD